MTTEVILPTVAEVLENAADIMEEWGWTQNQFICLQGKMCEEGAVAVSAGWHFHFQQKETGNWNYIYADSSRHSFEYFGLPVPTSEERRTARDLYTKARLALNAVGGGSTHNDRPDNTFEKSVAKLKEAAEYARAHLS